MKTPTVKYNKDMWFYEIGERNKVLLTKVSEDTTTTTCTISVAKLNQLLK